MKWHIKYPIINCTDDSDICSYDDIIPDDTEYVYEMDTGYIFLKPHVREFINKYNISYTIGVYNDDIIKLPKNKKIKGQFVYDGDIIIFENEEDYNLFLLKF